MRVTMLGTGAYGLALSLSLAKNKDNEVIMWSENSTIVSEFNQTHRFDRIFEGMEIPSNISITNNYAESLNDSDLIFIGCAAKYVGGLCSSIKEYYDGTTPICIASKGIEEQTGSFLSELVKNTLKADNVAVLSGPTFAIDMANGDPIALSLASTNEFTSKTIQDTLSSDTLKLKETDDLIGVQICGSFKNVIAIASGMIKGLGYSESTLAFLINESLYDIRKFIDALGGQDKTILEYAGIGDLLLTCTSTKSRNYSFGYVIGSTKDKKKIDEFLHTNTVEGYYALLSIHKIAKDYNIKLPIIDTMYDIIINGADPDTIKEFLFKSIYNDNKDKEIIETYNEQYLNIGKNGFQRVNFRRHTENKRTEN